MTTLKNQLIERLPAEPKRNLLKLCEPVQLTMAEILCPGGEAIQFVYFPLAGFASKMARLDGKPVVEVGMVGGEGMLGAEVALGVSHEPLHVVVQGGGSAWRIGRADIIDELAKSESLRDNLHKYLHVTTTQLATSAACLRFHQIGPRLARWLLMTQDRARSDHFHLTHEFLAFVLGMRRVGITQAAAILQRQGLVDYRRGEMSILDRAGLIKVACSCYAADNLTYAGLLG